MQHCITTNVLSKEHAICKPKVLFQFKGQCYSKYCSLKAYLVVTIFHTVFGEYCLKYVDGDNKSVSLFWLHTITAWSSGTRLKDIPNMKCTTLTALEHYMAHVHITMLKSQQVEAALRAPVLHSSDIWWPKLISVRMFSELWALHTSVTSGYRLWSYLPNPWCLLHWFK